MSKQLVPFLTKTICAYPFVMGMRLTSLHLPGSPRISLKDPTWIGPTANFRVLALQAGGDIPVFQLQVGNLLRRDVEHAQLVGIWIQPPQFVQLTTHHTPRLSTTANGITCCETLDVFAGKTIAVASIYSGFTATLCYSLLDEGILPMLLDHKHSSSVSPSLIDRTACLRLLDHDAMRDALLALDIDAFATLEPHHALARCLSDALRQRRLTTCTLRSSLFFDYMYAVPCCVLAARRRDLDDLATRDVLREFLVLVVKALKLLRADAEAPVRGMLNYFGRHSRTNDYLYLLEPSNREYLAAVIRDAEMFVLPERFHTDSGPLSVEGCVYSDENGPLFLKHLPRSILQAYFRAITSVLVMRGMPDTLLTEGGLASYQQFETRFDFSLIEEVISSL